MIAFDILRCEIGYFRTVCLLCRFIERKSLSSYSSGLICDIVGVVMFVSRDSRERKASKSFWASKWVHLKDGKDKHFCPTLFNFFNFCLGIIWYFCLFYIHYHTIYVYIHILEQRKIPHYTSLGKIKHTHTLYMEYVFCTKNVVWVHFIPCIHICIIIIQCSILYELFIKKKSFVVGQCQ